MDVRAAGRGARSCATCSKDAKVEVVFGERLDRAKGVKLDGKRIVSITMESGKTFAGKMFIDATYEGDLMAAAGVSYTVGREANAQYGETLNGVAKRWNTHSHRFTAKVDPYVKPGDPKSGLLSGIDADPLPGATARATTACRRTASACA